VSYEAGYLIEDRLLSLTKENYITPFFHLAVFEKMDSKITEFINPKNNSSIYNFSTSIQEDQYFEKMNSIKSYLEKGDSYQINYTLPVRFQTSANPRDFYESLLANQKVSYSSYLDLGDKQILSISPELFLYHKEGNILSKPMKGTAKRSPIPEIDTWIGYALQNSEKNRAENLMITDLIRNDLGKFSELGSVHVSELFSIETYQTMHQMVSKIESKLRKDTNFWDLFWGMFPCGSITGAPKISSMEIIHELEMEARGVYTGSIGYFAPFKSDFESQWNIAIRTIEYQNGKCKMGVGSGITYESDPKEEWEECQTKLEFMKSYISKSPKSSIDFENFNFLHPKLFENWEQLEVAAKNEWTEDPFFIFESIGWNGRNWKLLNFHLNRIKLSSNYFNIPFNQNIMKEELNIFIKDKMLTPGRIKYCLYENGSFKIEFFPLINPKNILKPKIAISPIRVQSDLLYLYHKTSYRRLYNKIYQMKKDYYDIIFLNEKSELTESCVHNLFLKKNGIYYTPILDSGLLRGTLREYVLKKYPNYFLEKVLTIEDFIAADEIILGNSVRGFTKCTY
jgi:para-aminobenzoate synthetase/4-amino-4-deoxychorismate lyase